jgi:hypothetical protein
MHDNYAKITSVCTAPLKVNGQAHLLYCRRENAKTRSIGAFAPQSQRAPQRPTNPSMIIKLI